MHLPIGMTDILTDSHYKCFRWQLPPFEVYQAWGTAIATVFGVIWKC
jgi:hypothetical protein